MSERRIIIIGSGPAGTAAALALAARGIRPLVLDVGTTLDAERRARVRRLASTDRRLWHPADLAALRGEVKADASGVEKKPVYGSEYPYGPDPHHPLLTRGARVFISTAKGGLSNAWGGALMPFAEADMAAWPFPVAALAPHYAAVAQALRPAASEDGLAAEYPLHCSPRPSGALSRQIGGLLQRLRGNEDALRRAGVTFGLSRLAADFGPRDGSEACAACGLCLSGCPWGRILNTADVLDDLVAQGLVDYKPGVHVESLTESEGGVRIAARSVPGGEESVFEASHCFLGAGVFSTSRILLRSLEAFDHPLSIAHSDYFTIPLLRFAGVPDVRHEELHTLAQLFVELRDPDVSPSTVHMQIYGYNDLIEQAVRGALGPLADLCAPLLPHLLGRLLLIQGYLHSDHSSRLIARLEPGDGGAYRVEGSPNPRARRTLCRLLRRLFALRGAFGALPLAPLAAVGLPGTGNHSGGSFPMQASPGPFQSDLLGRPSELPRVHVIDSSVFPSIPATTITFTIMANAHRIASQAPLD